MIARHPLWLRSVRSIRAASALIALVMLTGLVGARAAAEEVRREYLGLDLLANLELPAGASLEGGTVALILHGTLAHNGMEIITVLQANLARRGIASLAMTLSLGRNARRGAFPCDAQHEHRLTDAADEIGAWIDWLKERKVQRILLVGHSRGAQQIAHYTAGTPDPTVDRIALVAPPVDSYAERASRYRDSHRTDLQAIVDRARQLVEAGEEDTLIELPAFLHCRPARVTAAAVLDYVDPDGKSDTLALLRDVHLPVLIIAGAGDEIARDVVKKVRAAGLAADQRAVEIAGADHFFRDLFADDLVDALAPFLVEAAPRATGPRKP